MIPSYETFCMCFRFSSMTVRAGVVVTFTSVPDFAKLFSNLHEYGVAGVERQAQLIYQRVFLTRSKCPSIIIVKGFRLSG